MAKRQEAGHRSAQWCLLVPFAVVVDAVVTAVAAAGVAAAPAVVPSTNVVAKSLGMVLPLRAKLNYQKFSIFFRSFSFLWKSFLKFFWSIDRQRRRKQRCDDDDVEKTQKIVWKRSQTNRKRFKNDLKIARKRFENCTFSDGRIASIVLKLLD